MKKYRFLVSHASLMTILLATEAYADNPPILDYQVTAQKLDRARNGLSTETGSSTYHIDRKDIENLPQGDTTPLNQVLLQAPGVTQDSYGQLHVREDHDNLQYRIDGVLIPEGISGFGQTLDTHFADKISLLTGALPAQYGFRTAGIVDIQTKSGAFTNGGRSEVTVGSHGTIEGSQEFSGSKAGLNYYVNGSYQQNNLGIESPTSTTNPIHDFTRQDKLFGYFSYLLNSDTRLSVILANADNHFQIPNNPGQTPAFTVNGINSFDSANLNEKQNEKNSYGIVSLQGSTESNLDYQVSLFSRYSDVKFNPDPVGDLIFNGVASSITHSSLVSGLQSDFSYKLADTHTLRSGFYVSNEHAISDTSTSVFATNSDGTQASTQPFSIVDDTSQNAQLYGIYLQDEWKALDKLTINYGARFDISDAFVKASQFSPRLGAIYELTSKTKLHAGYARYFTPPPTELVAPATVSKFTGTSNASEVTLDNNVEPERTNYFDLGITHQLTPHFNVGLDGYYKDIHDLLDEGQFGQALILSPFNYARGKAYGLEFTSDYHLDNFSAYLNLAAQRAMGKDIVSSQYLFGQDELDYIASHYVHLDHDQTYTGSIGASYLLNTVRYNVDALYGSGLRSGFANSEHLPYYTQVNVGATHTFTIPQAGAIEGRFSIINLFDNSYEIRDGSGIGVGAPQFGPRRAYYVTISKSF